MICLFAVAQLATLVPKALELLFLPTPPTHPLLKVSFKTFLNIVNFFHRAQVKSFCMDTIPLLAKAKANAKANF
jgi:hypothetical protein